MDDTVQFNMRMPVKLKHQLEEKGHNKTGVIVRLLECYLRSRSSEDELRDRRREILEELAVIDIQLEDIEKSRGKRDLESDLQGVARFDLVKGWDLQSRFNFDDSANLGWLDGKCDKVSLAGFDDTRGCLDWLKKSFPDGKSTRLFLKDNGGV